MKNFLKYINTVNSINTVSRIIVQMCIIVIIEVTRKPCSLIIIVIFSLFHRKDCCFANMTPLTRRQCRVSNTQVNVKALGPLVTIWPRLSKRIPFPGVMKFTILVNLSLLFGSRSGWGWEDSIRNVFFPYMIK